MSEVIAVRHPKPADFKPVEFFPEDHKRWSGKRRCTAWNPNQGRQCNAPVVQGKTKCQSHGGMSPSGPAHGRYVNGKYSKDIVGDLKGRYETALDNKAALLSLDDEIAIIEGMIGSQLKELDSTPSKQLWSDARKKFINLKAASLTGNADAFTKAQLELEDIIGHGLSQAAGQDRVIELFNEKRKLVESQRKSLVDLHQTVLVTRAMSIFTTLVDEFTNTVLDLADRQTARQILSKTGRTVDRLLTAPEVSGEIKL